MPALPDEAGAQLLQRFLVSAGVNLLTLRQPAPLQGFGE